MAWKLGGMAVGLGGALIGLMLGTAFETAGIFLMLLSLAGAFLMLEIGRRCKPAHHKKEED